MSTQQRTLAGLRTRWSAIGAAIAITLGAGGIGLAQAAVDSGDKPITVTVDSKRILDTRTNLGLAGGFVKDTPRDVQVTGPVDVATATGTATETVVPAGASAVLVNVTVVTPTDVGFLTLRAGGATGAPTTSTVNFAAPGGVEPNAATVDLSADGKLQVWVFMPSATARADVLIDVVGYTIDHNHDDRYYQQSETYTKAEVDAVHAEIDAALPLFGSIFQSGAIQAQGRGLVSVDHPSTGVYLVTFDRDISECVAFATDSLFSANNDPSADATIPGGDTVRVEVRDSTNALVDTYFSVMVLC